MSSMSMPTHIGDPSPDASMMRKKIDITQVMPLKIVLVFIGYSLYVGFGYAAAS